MPRIKVEDRVADRSYSAPHRKRLLAAPSSDRYVSRLLQGKFSGGAKRFMERVLLVVEPSSTFCMHFCAIFHLRRRTTSASSLPIHNPPSHHLWLIVFYCSACIAAVCRVGGAKLLLCRAGGWFDLRSFFVDWSKHVDRRNFSSRRSFEVNLFFKSMY